MRLIPLFFLFSLLCACLHSQESSEQSLSAQDSVQHEFQQQFMTLINAHRKDIGVRALSLHSSLSSIALSHSTNMANETVDFGHTGMNSRCVDARAAIAGGNLCAENVAMGQTSAQKVFEAWLNSPGHRANMENSRHTHMGIAYKQNADGTYYWTQILVEKN